MSSATSPPCCPQAPDAETVLSVALPGTAWVLFPGSGSSEIPSLWVFLLLMAQSPPGLPVLPEWALVTSEEQWLLWERGTGEGVSWRASGRRRRTDLPRKLTEKRLCSLSGQGTTAGSMR